MQSFYKRFIRDYVRYRDNIQCVGHELVKLVRQDSLALNPAGGGVYYALHVRRGDLQYKDVKISATEIVQNLNITDDSGKLIIPPGSLVYISTDDPDGVCKGCTDKNGHACENLPSPKPEGCPEDVSKYINFTIHIAAHYLYITCLFKTAILECHDQVRMDAALST